MQGYLDGMKAVLDKMIFNFSLRVADKEFVMHDGKVVIQFDEFHRDF